MALTRPKPKTAVKRHAPKPKKKPLKLKAAPTKQVRDAKAKGDAVAPVSEILPVPKPPFKPAPLSEIPKGTTSAKAVLLPPPAPPVPKKAVAAAKPVKPLAAPAAPRREAKAPAAKALPAPVKYAAARESAPQLPAARVRPPKAAPERLPDAPKLNRSSKLSPSASAGGGSGGGGGGGGGGRGGGGKSGKSAISAKPKGSAGAPTGKGAAAAKKSAATVAGTRGPGFFGVPLEPPSLPVVVQDGVRRLAAPPAAEPALPPDGASATAEVNGVRWRRESDRRWLYSHDGAWWLPARDGRTLPSLLVGGVYRTYELKDGAVVLRPAFPGMFQGRADDPTLVLFADPAGKLLVQVSGNRADGALWADVEKPKRLASLGSDIRAVSFKDARVAVTRRDGKVSLYNQAGAALTIAK